MSLSICSRGLASSEVLAAVLMELIFCPSFRLYLCGELSLIFDLFESYLTIGDIIDYACVLGFTDLCPLRRPWSKEF